MEHQIKDITDYCISTGKIIKEYWDDDKFHIRVYQNYDNSRFLPYDSSIVCVRKGPVVKNDYAHMEVVICNLYKIESRITHYRISMYLHLIHRFTENLEFTLEDFFKCEGISVLSSSKKIKPKTVLEALQIYGS